MKTIKVIAGIALIFFAGIVLTALVYWARNYDVILIPYMLIFIIGFITFPISDWYQKLKP